MNNEKISWNALEYEYREKTSDWFWTFGIITFSILVVVIMFENYLLAIIIAISAFLIVLYSHRPPQSVYFELNKSGIVIEKTLYPYASLESFWVEQNDARPKILLKSKKVFMPLLAIPLEKTDPQEVREFLSPLLKETEYHEPATQKIMEHFGF